MASPQHSLSVRVRELNELPFPNFRKPEEIACFSTKGSSLSKSDDTDFPEVTTPYVLRSSRDTMPRSLCESSAHNKMVLVDPLKQQKIKFDLNAGYGSQVPKADEKEYLNVLLLSLLKENLVGQSEFVSWRGLLTKLAATPYDAGGKFDDGLMLCVQKIGKTFYMCEFPTKSSERAKEAMTERQKEMAYWGMKFESYVTATEGSKPHPEVPMNFNHEFGSVVRTKLGSHSMMYGGEVDCYHPETSKYVELKTTRKIEHRGQESSFRRFKLMKWWLQSFLIGIEDVLCGFRDDHGIVDSCRWYSVSEMPRLARTENNNWKPNVCFNFLHEFLDYIKHNVTEEFVPHVIERKPNETVFHLRQDTSSDFIFVPAWFAKEAMM